MTLLLLDGGMGTALLASGLPVEASPERWLLERPEAIAAVHAAHARAGAEVVLTCTFNLAAPRLRASGVTSAVEALAARAVALARSAAPSARVAGALGPTGLAGQAPPAELRERYAEAFRALAAAGVDLLWAESLCDLAEARAALAAAHATGLPAVVTFTFRDGPPGLRTASGEAGEECLRAVASAGAAAVGVNCALPESAQAHAALVARCAGALGVPIVAKPSAGLPGAVIPPGAFADRAVELRGAGASWLGGCCGATAEHLAAVALRLRGR
ncbi:MAG TPA: homocysteine S-methyltransferase family protein [Anaeromyxobacteraceae bacterium]|nr:homocysteine S-methyltransferase family protein [Anaeromyxobacteraceae bacterium]